MAENRNETGRLAPPRANGAARGETGGNLPAPPRHIAIIMDGNGRWATRRGLPRTAGHKAGAETFRKIATYCKDIGVKYLTVYAFSTENWKRSETEVSAIMALLKKYLLEAVDTMERDHIRLHFFGDMTPIAPELRALARETDEITEHLSKDDFQANVCLNYGGRDEILRAARRFAEECAGGRRKPEELDEACSAAYAAMQESLTELKQVEKTLDGKKELQRQVLAYSKTRPVRDGLKQQKNAKAKAAYRQKHESDFIIADAAARYFKENGISKLPGYKALQAEIESLIKEKNSGYNDYRAKREEYRRLQTVKGNIDQILHRERKPVKRQEQER